MKDNSNNDNFFEHNKKYSDKDELNSDKKETDNTIGTKKLISE